VDYETDEEEERGMNEVDGPESNGVSVPK